jgi:transcriptional regulator
MSTIEAFLSWARLAQAMGRQPNDLLQGTLDLLILRILSREQLHGWGISKRIRQLSEGTLEVNQGSLYPALYRLRDRGLVEGDWGISEEGRRAKFYRLTRAGRAEVEIERDTWAAFSRAVNQVLEGA